MRKKSIAIIVLLSILFSCGTTVNHCKKARKDAWKAQKKMDRARRRASRFI